MVNKQVTAPRAPANRAELIATMRDVVLSEQFYGATSGEVASGILSALEAAGVRLVPVEMTGEMWRAVAVNWGRRTWQEFADVVAASPYAPEGK